jgi:hypothetical protein
VVIRHDALFAAIHHNARVAQRLNFAAKNRHP